ncbi:hypothetical protein BS17DRAFT_694107 [Gyrodon lividus]|nr:hypothetical protein BS17DRAFT_694107 [Gyrodon lividus]
MQMVELLHSAVHHHAIGPMVELEGPYLHIYIKSAFKAGETSYKDSPSFSQAQGLGESLQMGQCTSIGFITNINGNHWVARVIEFSHLVW